MIYRFLKSAMAFKQESAEIVDDNLVLHLTKQQQEEIISYYDNGLENFGKVDGVELLSNNSGFVITGDKKTVADIIGHDFTVGVFSECAFRQLFGGVDCDDIAVSIKVVDINSQKTLYEAAWPQETIELGVQDWDFSENSRE